MIPWWGWLLISLGGAYVVYLFGVLIFAIVLTRHGARALRDAFDDDGPDDGGFFNSNKRGRW
jgi:hypothetical protein